MVAQPFGRSAPAARRRPRSDELLERFGLAGKADELAGDLSHGEQRRLEIAVALACEPKMLLLDEPTQGMSHGDTEDTAEPLRSARSASDMTVLLIEHDIGLVMNLSDHVIVMHQGRKLAEGPPADVRANPAVQAAYFGACLTCSTISGPAHLLRPGHIIQGIDLDAAPRRGASGMFGRNGVGKTTLLKTIAGWIKPTCGRDRASTASASTACEPTASAMLGVGFVPEDRRIFPGLTVEENLELGFLQVKRRLGRGEPRGAGAVYDTLPASAANGASSMGTTLSGGEQQMLAMARVMVGKPNLLLIDEPSEGLAPMIVAEIFAILRDLRDSGAILLLVEQNVHEALSLADRFYAVERGRIVLEGMAESPSDRERLMATISV